MQKLLLVIPPCFTNRELDFEIGFPAHLLTLGRAARDASWDVEYLDMTLEEKEGYDSFAELDRRLNNPALGLVGISNHTVRTSVTTRAVAERVKALRPQVPVVVGGVNATFMWRELFETCLEIDYVLRGYAQPGLRALLNSLRGGPCLAAPGLAARRGDSYHLEPMQAVTAEDFDAPLFEKIDVDRYLSWTKSYPLLTHTGCGFSCNFCTSVMPGPYQNREVYRSPRNVVKEMRAALGLGFDRFFMSANIFTSRRDYCLELCQAMRQEWLPGYATWVCMTRVEFVDAELLEAMRAAGCVNIAFGVESAGAGQWKSLRKGRFNEQTVRRAFLGARRAGIGTTAYLMLGAPSQTPEDVEATIRFTSEIDPDYRVVSFFQPFPGTPYWEAPEKFGLSEIAPLEEWNFHEAPVCRTRHLSKQELLEAATRLYLGRKDAGRLSPSLDALEVVSEPPQTYGDMPLPARQAFSGMGEGLSVAKVLERVACDHGARGRLIALYWMSAALRDGVVRLAGARP